MGNNKAFCAQAFDFVPSARFPVSIYPDWATAQAPSANALAVGELTLGTSVYTDDSRNEGGINEDPAALKKPIDLGRLVYGAGEKLNSRGALNAASVEPIPLVLSRGASAEHKALKQHSVAEGWRKAWRDRIKKTTTQNSRWVKDDGVHADTTPRVQKMAKQRLSWVEIDGPPHPAPKKSKWLW